MLAAASAFVSRAGRNRATDLKTMSSDNSTHWCHGCNRPVRPNRGCAVLCPNCNGGFVQELDDSPTAMGQRVDLAGDDRYAGGGGEALEDAEYNDLLDSGALDSDVARSYNRGYMEYEDLINALALSDRPRPPPAGRSSADCLTTVEISRKHLGGDSQCPVCMERFELGNRVQEMPCKHLFHKECIVPWLAQHETCPVCRRRVGDRRDGRRNPFASFWPFDPSDLIQSFTS